MPPHSLDRRIKFWTKTDMASNSRSCKDAALYEVYFSFTHSTYPLSLQKLLDVSKYHPLYHCMFIRSNLTSQRKGLFNLLPFNSRYIVNSFSVFVPSFWREKERERERDYCLFRLLGERLFAPSLWSFGARNKKAQFPFICSFCCQL